MSKIPPKLSKREQILEAGVSLLMQYGYHGTGLKRILDEVQIPKGSFYGYFKSKEDFIAEAITYYTEGFLEDLRGFLNNPSDNGFVALKKFYRSLINTKSNNDFNKGCLHGDLMGEVATVSEKFRANLYRAVEDYVKLLEGGLKSGQEHGQVRNDISARAMADMLFDSWQGALLRSKLNQSVAPLEECYTHLFEDYFLV
ncbi:MULTISPECIES: TetR/AcrR family transcriptional regulator [Methylophaga]|jgi:TetR/AcrR family transcriptional repressor of nem operon|uniref:TetR/AcrR family transcriptional regulator n=1 Tax=Methylophaga TaxID=40222 RepID=UPI000C6930DA|nr:MULTISPECIES: TetR/AcrR family transcriptional regulator [Methylophaga]MAX51735.1 TetR family transcriptional regulator [Methylophaga sp.]WVI83993.1 TetR family transcriptional regulator C-terminal domain-containing protein [Methylophaga thalassica]|tara:strand:- start:9599 stop:10195 length:597 start_codon:yes stop_codon:yes gene_type:complete